MCDAIAINAPAQFHCCHSTQKESVKYDANGLFSSAYYSFHLCLPNSKQHAQIPPQQHIIAPHKQFSSIKIFVHLFLTNYCALTILHFNHFRLHRPNDSVPKKINKIIGFTFGLLRRKVTFFIRLFDCFLNWSFCLWFESSAITKKSSHVCLSLWAYSFFLFGKNSHHKFNCPRK